MPQGLNAEEVKARRDGGEVNVGAIAGAVAGGAVLAIVVALLFLWK